MAAQTNLEPIIYSVLSYWKERNFTGNDVSDITSSRLYSKLILLNNNTQWGKYIYFPFNFIAKRFPNTIRSLFNLDSSYMYPQAHSLIIRGIIELYHKNQDSYLKELIFKLADELLQMRNKSFTNYSWGQPFEWPSRTIMSSNVPRTTVTSQVGAAFLDIYETFGEDRFLNYATKICDFYIDDLNYTYDQDGDICFSYTTEDNYHIHNASILAASILYRTSYFTKISQYLDYGEKAANFTAKNQNTDGSWYYRSKPDRVKGMIDNYHTGYVLEAFADISQYYKGVFPYQEQLEKGLKFYIENFISSSFQPKYRPTTIYPVDIQACAQSIITLGKFHNLPLTKTELLRGVLNYTIEHFYNKNGYFYYRYYGPSKVDRNNYLRWGDSWMVRALSIINNII